MTSNIDFKTLKDKNILIVDDTPENLRVLTDYLNEYEVNIRIAISGQDAIELLKNYKPDLILLDILMPKMTGYEVCHILKSHEHTKDIPIIFLTALNTEEDKLKAFEVGGVDFLSKPLQYSEVMARIRIHLTLVEQNQKLIQLNATKDRFVSIISHDLRGPLGSVKMLSDTLLHVIKKAGDMEDIKKFAKDMNNTIEKTNKFLENLLDWSRLQKGTFLIQPNYCRIADCLIPSFYFFNDLLKQKQIELQQNIPENLEVYADSNIINTIFRNLISNAIKFTYEGQITLSAQAEDENTVVVCVSDTGKGMDEEVKNSLFQIDKIYSTTGTQGERGTGLGLILCKEMLEKVNGRIWVESEEEKGSSFYFSLPKNPT